MKFINTLRDCMMKLFSYSGNSGARFVKAASLAFAILIQLSAYAQREEGIESVQESAPLTGNGIAPNAVILQQYQDDNEASVVIKNVIILSVLEEGNQLIPYNFTATVKVNIRYGESALNYHELLDQEFTVSYTKEEGAKYNAKNYLSLDNAKYIRIEVVTVTPNPSSGTGGFDARSVLSLSSVMKAKRYFELSTNPSFLQPATALAASVQPPVTDELVVSWQWHPGNQTGNNYTQIEWTWLEDDFSPLYFNGGSSVNTDLLFFNNATRVDVPVKYSNYSIPLLYNGIGKLYYRIRAVNIRNSGERQDGPWITGTPYAFNGHEPALNWQVSTSFAEDSKRKTVMQYFDGSLRGRQTVTKDNTTKTAVTSETIYDGQGRAAVSILPAPSMDKIIAYRANLNLFNGQASGLQDPSDFFDLMPVNAAGTAFYQTPALSNTSGSTAQYYSPSNPEMNSDNASKLIPDAEGYPYTVTRYTPDATGRILAQSGVGSAMNMGSGKETRYYYGTPAQEELDGLFGTEVGEFTHYFKTMVKDANGQISVSYTDMHGRTIATALAGDPVPGTLVPLSLNATDYPNQEGNIITRNLLANGTNIIKNNSVIESTTTLLVPFQTNYEFTYNLNPQSLLAESCTTDVFICLDCSYDLEFSITDDSGEQDPILYKYSNVSLSGTVDDNCSTPILPFDEIGSAPAPTSTNNIIFNVALPTGSYTVRKSLKINEASLQQYIDLYMSKVLCKTEQDIIDSVYNVLLEESDCNDPNYTPAQVSCDDCLNQLGTLAQYQANYLASIGNPSNPPAAILTQIQTSYNNAKMRCTRVCTGISQQISAKRRLMIMDMIPYTGQYAINANLSPGQSQIQGISTVAPNNTMYNTYNIFSTENIGTLARPFYRNPLTYQPNPLTINAGQYLDANGVVDVTIHPPAPAANILSTISGPDFKNLFKNSWADALLPYHPEFRKLIFAEEKLTPTYDWINRFGRAEDWAQAVAGDVSVSGDTYLMLSQADLVNDPFFAVPEVSANTSQYLNPFVQKVFVNYMQVGATSSDVATMWQIARASIKCRNLTGSTATACVLGTPGNLVPLVPPFSDITSDDEKAALWQAFSGMYQSERDQLVNKLIKDNTPTIPAQTLVDEHYILRFPETINQIGQQYSNTSTSEGNSWNWIPTTPGGPPPPPVYPPANPNPGQAAYQSQCHNYIDYWKQSLRQCTTLTEAMITTIVTRMEQVCINGSDAQNPYGSSNIGPNPTVPVNDQSFEAIINDVLASNGISRTNFCNPFVIEFPRPYGKGPRLVNPPISTLESCNCERFQQIKTAATASSFDPNNFASLNAYLLQTYGETISQGLFNAYQHCDELEQTTCTQETTIIWYNCNEPVPTCPVIIKGKLNNITDTVKNQKSFTDKSTSIRNGITSIANSAAPEMNCENLQNCIEGFYIDQGIGIDDQGESTCREAFIYYFNNYFQDSYNWNQIVDKYWRICCVYPDVCSPRFNCVSLNTIVTGFYAYAPADIDDATDCINSFVEYFNAANSSNYTWEQIERIYIHNCGISPSICIPTSFTCTQLTNLIQDFRDDMGTTLTNENCRCLFVEYFELKFGPGYETWERIVAVYQRVCGAPPAICENRSPDNCEDLQASVTAFYAFYGSSIDDESASCVRNFVKFFNIHFHVDFSWENILTVFNKYCCGAPLVCIKPFECNQLNNVVTSFFATYGTNTNENPINCQTLFTDHFNNELITSYTWNEIQQIYLRNCGHIPDVCIPPVTCQDLIQIETNFLSEYANEITPENCRCLFLKYFNDNTNWGIRIWEQVEELYLNNCNRLPNVCRQVNINDCEDLQESVQSFNASFDPGSGNCRESYVTYFNQYFSVSYTWEQIMEKFQQTCCSLPKICPPEITCSELTQVEADFIALVGVNINLDPNCENAFTEFFNSQLNNGIQYTWIDIQQMYLNQCGMVPYICLPYVTSCTELDAFINAFMVAYASQLTPSNCKCLFTGAFNTEYGTNLTWDEIEVVYYRTCKKPLLICSTYTCQGLESLVAEFLQLHGSTVNQQPDCKELFVAFFNDHYHTNYDWETISYIYENTCGEPLDVCSCRLFIECPLPPVCTTTYQPYVLPVPQPFPAFLACDYEPNCIDCADLSSLVAEYKAYFVNTPYNDAPIFTGTNLSNEQIAQNANFARFVNYRTGFRFSWLDYSRAAEHASPECNLNQYQSNSNQHQNVICGNQTPITIVTDVNHEEPCQHIYNHAVSIGTNLYQIRVQYLLNAINAAYRQKCLAVEGNEIFKVRYNNKEYHYTLYYYDQAGNLVSTVPPKGVRPDFSPLFTNQVRIRRESGDFLTNPYTRPHEMSTQYRYNSLGQVVAQSTPDADKSSFWYDRLGRLVVSQNAQQLADQKYSYTLYDPLGRIREVGQKPHTTPMNQSISQDPVALENWMAGGSSREQITQTTYDFAVSSLCDMMPDLSVICQQNLRNRVSYTMYFDDESMIQPLETIGTTVLNGGGNSATFYSYDIHGNVDELVNDYSGIAEMNTAANKYKKLKYDYDLISGKVNRVNYQPGKPDAFYHRYQYDDENRITATFTSRDAILWEKDASYQYFKHGPLSRTVLGQMQVQGLDYAYTLQGWLKGVNGTGIYQGVNDIGKDGLAGASTVARDIVGFALHYYDDFASSGSVNDFKAISGSSVFARPDVNTGFVSLFNGNIGGMTVNNLGIPDNANSFGEPVFNKYRYDQLNRIVSMRSFKGLNRANNVWTPIQLDDYAEDISYDPNGNIMDYNRAGTVKGGSPLAMDQMNYHYIAGSNKLDHVTDAVPASNYPEDIDGQGAGNYTYDAIGNLISDDPGNSNNPNGIADIKWTVYGKIKLILKNTGQYIRYTYDASGNRISKTYDGKVTIYARDASGNVMSVYEAPEGGTTVVQRETHLYGSSRLGLQGELTVATTVINLEGDFASTNAKLATFTRGEKFFELSNHLGNVLATVTDKHIAKDDGVYDANSNQTSTTPDGQIDYYTADVASANDYYPFGMMMPGRKFNAGGYRYGFNGKENDNEVKGEGNSLDFGARIYDPRIGRWLSVDAVAKLYPDQSPYNSFGDDPINTRDFDGNILRDKDGNIIYQKIDLSKNPSVKKAYDQASIDATNATGGKYKVKIEAVFIFDNKGRGFAVEKYTVIDTKTNKEVDNSNLDVSYNCHGFSALSAKFRVNSDLNVSNSILLDKAGINDYKKRLVDVVKSDFAKIKKGDIVVLFDKNNEAIHSYVYSGKDATEDKVDSKNGENPLQKGVTVSDIENIYKPLGAVKKGFFTPVKDKKLTAKEQAALGAKVKTPKNGTTEITQ